MKKFSRNKERWEVMKVKSHQSPLKSLLDFRLGSDYIIYVVSSFNNTFITLYNFSLKKPLFTVSCGLLGLKGNRKSTPFAAEQLGEKVSFRLDSLKIHSVSVRIRGIGAGKFGALKGLIKAGIKIVSIIESSDLAYGGTKAKKVRRV